MSSPAASIAGGGGGSDVVTATLINVDNLRLDGNTLSSTNTNGDINLTPNGTGDVVVTTDGAVVSVVNTGVKVDAPTSGEVIIDKGDAGSFGSLHFHTAGVSKYKVQHDSGDTLIVGREGGQTLTFSASGMPVFSGYSQWAGQSFLAADATNATTTMAATGLTVAVTSGRKYSFRAVLRFTNDVAGDGAKFDFDASTATATNFRAVASGGAVTTGAFAFVSAVALATDFAYASTDGAAQLVIEGSIEPSANGTFAMQFAKNSHTTGTLTLHRGSSLMVWDMP